MARTRLTEEAKSEHHPAIEVQARALHGRLVELEREAAELAGREHRLRASFDASSRPAAILTRDGSVLEMNPVALGMSGATRQESVGKSFGDLAGWPLDFRSAVCDAIRTCAWGTIIRWPADADSPSPAEGALEVTLSPVYAESDVNLVAFVLMEGREPRTTGPPQDIEASIQRAFAEIAESSATFQHELKNPITAINVALRAVATELGEDHRGILEDFVARMQKVEALARRAFFLTRPLAPKREDCDAQALLIAATTRLSSEFDRGDAMFETDVEPGGVRITTDPELLKEALTEILAHVLLAHGRGTRIRLSARRVGALAVLAIEDDGQTCLQAIPPSMRFPRPSAREAPADLRIAVGRKIVEALGGMLVFMPSEGPRLGVELRIPVTPSTTEVRHGG